jgi:hypothetical protein
MDHEEEGGCCPSPDHPIIPNAKHLETKRKALYAIMWGDVFASICMGFIFGINQGLLRLVTVWIDYMGYATMHFCIVMIMGLMGLMDTLILLSNASDSGYY